MRLLFRCDSGQQIGTGHVQRGLTLAEALKRSGPQEKLEIVFYGLDLVGNIAQQISDRGFPVQLFKTDAEALKEAQKTRWDWVIFDSYHIDQELEKKWRSCTQQILVIDDLANRFHDCDLLLDTNVHAEKNPYEKWVPSFTTALVGPKYALLREEFRKARPAKPFPSDRQSLKKRGLIFFGGTDPLQLLPTYYESLLSNSALMNRYEFDFLVSPQSPSAEMLRKYPAHPRLHLQIGPPSVASLMLKAGFYLGSGGTITWERMHLGLTGAVLAVAENQVDNAQNLQNQKAHWYFGKAQALNPEDVLKKLEEFISEPQILMSMSERCYEAVDGSGSGSLLSLILQNK